MKLNLVHSESDKENKDAKPKKTDKQKQDEAEFQASSHLYGFMFRLDDWTVKMMNMIYLVLKASKYSSDFNCECESYAIDKIFNEKANAIIAWNYWLSMLARHLQILTVNLKEIVADVERAHKEAKPPIIGIDAQDEVMNFMTMLNIGIQNCKAEKQCMLTLVQRADVSPENMYTFVNLIAYEAVIEKVKMVAIYES